MQILDDRGRLFGKVNIIDAAVLVVVCVLIPVAYGAYLLFRTLPARIVAVEPTRVPHGTEQIKVRGERLRPYLRFTVGAQDATLLFQTPDVGVLQLPSSLPPGSYDVALYDDSMELNRLPGGLVVDPPPAPPPPPPPPPPSPKGELVAIGVFPGLDARGARTLMRNLQAVRQKATTWGQVIGFQPPEPNIEYLQGSGLPLSDGTSRIKAVLRFRCTVGRSECRVQNVAISPGASVPLAIGDGTAEFRVEEVRPPDGASAQLLAPPELVELLAAGTFRGLTATRAQTLAQNLEAAGAQAVGWGRIVGFQPPRPNVDYVRTPGLPVSDGTYQISAVLRLRCRLAQSECRAQNIPLTPGATLPVAVRGTTADFRIEELHPPYTTSVEVQIKSYISSEEVVILKNSGSEIQERFPARDALRPSVISFDRVGETTDGQQEILMVRLRVPAVETPDGWVHGGVVLRVGDDFAAQRPSFTLRGRIVGIGPARRLSDRP